MKDFPHALNILPCVANNRHGRASSVT
jgi:hypothetical protein